MEKIIQITSDSENLYCLTADGKVWERRAEYIGEANEDNKKRDIDHYWRELPLHEITICHSLRGQWL